MDNPFQGLLEKRWSQGFREERNNVQVGTSRYTRSDDTEREKEIPLINMWVFENIKSNDTSEESH